MSTSHMSPEGRQADLSTEKLAGVTVDPGDGTVCPTLDYVLIRGFHAMGWAHPMTACRDMIEAAARIASPSPELRPMEAAPKTDAANMIAQSVLGWCPDETAPNGGDWRVIWWEPKLSGGIWYGDRDLPESPIGWVPLPALPRPVLTAATVKEWAKDPAVKNAVKPNTRSA